MDEPHAGTDAEEAGATADEERALRQLIAAEEAFDATIEAHTRSKSANEAEVRKATQALIKAQAALSYERRKHEQDLNRDKQYRADPIDFDKIRAEIRGQLDRIRGARAAERVSEEPEA